MSKPKTPFKFYKGWAEAEGRKVQLGRPNPKTIYTPRVDGVMPDLLGSERPEKPELDDDDDHRVPVDVMFKRNGAQ